MKESEIQLHIERAEELYAEQNIVGALVAGAVAIVPAALAYGIIAMAAPLAAGFAAAAAGIIVGLAVGYLGRGIENTFSLIAAGYTTIACALGVLTPYFLSDGEATVTDNVNIAMANVSVLHLLYLFVAIFAAVFLAKRGLSRSDRLSLGTYEMRK